MLHTSDLMRVDRMTMAFGIEARVPFLSQSFVDYVMSINPCDKLYAPDRIEKTILRQAFTGRKNSTIHCLLY